MAVCEEAAPPSLELGLGGEGGDKEAGDLDSQSLVDVAGEGLAELFQYLDLTDNFGSEIPPGSLPGGADQVGDHILPDSDQLADGVGRLNGFFFLLIGVILLGLSLQLFAGS